MKHSLVIIAVSIASFLIGWWAHSTKIDVNANQFKVNLPEKEDTSENVIASDSNCISSSLKEYLQYALHDTSKKRIVVDTIILNKETAVKVAESILFPIYGESQIKSERPYEVCFAEGYWIVNGYQHRGEGVATPVGGTFVIIINATNGKVIKLTHYQ